MNPGAGAEPVALWRDEALARAVRFARLGGHRLDLALHAAVPLILTPELLHLIRLNFVPRARAIAEADLLLSPLCQDAGGGFYQMDAATRDLLLGELRRDFGEQQIVEVARFLDEYVTDVRPRARQPEELAFLLALEWTALAYRNPPEAARALVLALNDHATHGRPGEALRVASAARALATPLLGQDNVLLYAACFEKYAAGEAATAADIYDALAPHGQTPRVGDVPLLSLRQIADAFISRPAEVTNSLGMKFVLIPPGKFLMGSPEDEAERYPDEGPQHEVEITRPFYLGAYQVTQEEYEKVMGANPSYFSATGEGRDRVKGLDTRRFPVETVSWEEAVEFCRRLSELPEEKRAGRLYRLPTEAEWEYSCRGRAFSLTPFYFEAPSTSASSTQANFNGKYPYGGALEEPYLERTTTVGSYKPNALGLYDMHGNVYEWCADWFGENYYQKSSKKDPVGPKKGSGRVVRGGSWFGNGWGCRAADRDRLAPDGRGYNVGLRVVLAGREDSVTS